MSVLSFYDFVGVEAFTEVDNSLDPSKKKLPSDQGTLVVDNP